MKLIHDSSNLSPLARLMEYLRLSENSVLLVLAVTVGLLTGVSVWLFRRSIEWFHELFVVQLADTYLSQWVGVLGIVIALALAGFIVGFITQRFAGHEKIHGVAGIIAAVALAGGRLQYKLIPFKAVASALSLGAGASVGPEDPSVQIGANMGAFLGHRLRLSEDRVRLLVTSGAASAIAAAFNAPIAGVFFALEVILGEFTTSAFSVVVLSAVISSTFMQFAEHAEAELATPAYKLGSPVQLIFCALLGLALAPVASLFIRIMFQQRELWKRYVHLPLPAGTALTGALVGIVAIFLPQIMGAGQDVMNDVLNGRGDYTVELLLALGAAKLMMTAVSIAGGFVGGVFAPTLFVGIMFGSAFGSVVGGLAPVTVVGDPRSYAIVGMAATMAGVVRAPITAILLVFELTNDYNLILPIMLASVICVYLAERIGPEGIYKYGLVKQGIRISEGRDVDVMQGVTVDEAMRTPPPKISESASLSELRDTLRHHNTRSLCVVDSLGRLAGIVTLTDLQHVYERASRDGIEINRKTVGDICTRDVVTAEPDDVLWSAIRKMSTRDISSVPVTLPGTHQLLGLLRRNDVIQAYNLAIARKLQDQHHAEQIRLNALTGGHVFECRVAANAPVVGRRICDMDWPTESVIASVQRKDKLIVPHGYTELQADDLLTIVADPGTQQELEALCGEPAERP